MTLELDAKQEAFWQVYVASLPDAAEAARRFYEAFSIGDNSEAADEGAALIKRGARTATIMNVKPRTAALVQLAERRVELLGAVTRGVKARLGRTRSYWC